MTEQLDEEIISINAIYSGNALEKLSDDPTICTLLLPSIHHISLRLDFPGDYPDAPPSILGTQTVGDDLPIGFGQRVVDLARDVLSEVYTPGSPCIFDLVEEVVSKLEQLSAVTRESEDQISGQSPQNAFIDGQQLLESKAVSVSDDGQSLPLLEHVPPWIVSDVATEKKSSFVARAAGVTSTEEAKAFLQHLLVTDKKVAKATHNITAWRIRGSGETVFQDCDDDGETAAGGRLLHLLQLMDVWNVMVVVTRWYGGVHLGPDRFRIINTVAREAVVRGGFSDSKDKQDVKKPRKK